MHSKLFQFFALTTLFVIDLTASAPLSDSRQSKSLNYFDYLQPDDVEYNTYETEDDDYSSSIEDNDLSRTIPSSTRKRLRPASNNFNSPIYYIRLPPQPYMFVPGLGYMPQPPPSPISQFVNLPVSFVANGKPSTIYQWTGGLGEFPSAPALPPKKPQVKPPPTQSSGLDSTIHRLPGRFPFNGKPEDIFVLRDSYNSLYGDALQNFYP